MDFEVVNKERTYKLLLSCDAQVYQGEAAGTGMSEEEWLSRNAFLLKQATVSERPFQTNVATVVPMPWWEELIVCFAWSGFFGLMLFTPFVLVWLTIFNRPAACYLSGFIFVLHFVLPRRFRPDLCRGYLAKLMLKYFSHRGLWKENLPIDRPSIIVAPPHGLFPIGSLLAVVSLPRVTGLYLRGLAADALLNIPLVGTRMRALGLTSASRHNAQKMLREGWTIGISSGGIAEIFETSSSSGSDAAAVETIILKSRGGLAKLALQTGSYLVPSYIFGNNQCLTVAHDPFGIMRRLSRFFRVSIVFFWGRFGLPIPHRVPLLGVLGAPIKVPLVPEPTSEQVAALLAKLEQEVQVLFDEHKSAYGWQHARLEIK